ncbi:MAG: EFR1 family ferrodoxin [Synergistaceae bacterium]|nr:EFR1 family ferrodoxin [Synergistaceae bacterium]
MDIKKVTAIYFSPTGGTRKYAVEIAKAIKNDYEEIDLTQVCNREKEYVFNEDELVVFGSPVYFGRIPQIKGGIFERIKGNKTKAIYTVTYGNRNYEDALLEQGNICGKNGFVGIAAAALIAPHAFSSKIAQGHPNNADISALEVFVKRVKEIIEKEEYYNKDLVVRGKMPYRKYLSAPFYPNAKKKCKKCGTCIEKCPMEAISANNPEMTDSSKCIACFACVKSCPYKVRTVKNLMFYLAKYVLERKLVAIEKIPEFFYIS